MMRPSLSDNVHMSDINIDTAISLVYVVWSFLHFFLYVSDILFSYMYDPNIMSLTYV